MKTQKVIPDPESRSVDDMVEILSTDNQADRAVIESMFSDNGIDYVIAGGNIHYAPVQVFVRFEQASRALEIVQSLNMNYSRIAFTWRGPKGSNEDEKSGQG